MSAERERELAAKLDNLKTKVTATTYGVFEVRPHPKSYPDVMRLCQGHADRGIYGGGWYVVIDNAGIAPDRGWGYGVSWYHPDPEFQIPTLGTFDEHLVPTDDAAHAIVAFVKAENRVA